MKTKKKNNITKQVLKRVIRIMNGQGNEETLKCNFFISVNILNLLKIPYGKNWD